MKTKIQDDIKSAMKARDQRVLDTLRCAMAAIKQVEVDTRKELDDAAIITILQKEIKKRRDSIEFAEKANRQDIVDQNKFEISLIQKYLGEQLSEDELKKVIADIVAAGNDNIGKIMGELNKSYKGKFEGKAASEIIKQVLAK